MIEKTSEFIERLMVCEPAVRAQFEYSDLEAASETAGDPDPLCEQDYEVAPGLINKYGNRVLCLLTTECPAYCRFCTRRRLVGDGAPDFAGADRVDAWVEYLNSHPEVREAIISGGDPFVVEDALFRYALEQLSAVASVKVLRIGTRAPVTDPMLVTDEKLDAIAKVEQPVYVGIHFEHPSELTPQTVRCVRNLRLAGAILYSQTVFLRGINDDYRTLYDLFTGLLEIGVRPYYIYRCDPVPGAAHFRVDPAKERHIMTELRRTLSGLACPTYVIDAPHGSGKIPVPLEFWECDMSSYKDFDGKRHANE
ncbi:MAG: KamA family radical SAM protein [Armatimonadota bacterium]|nr:KamA family radical SAM protein [Armatimonadota bacterium]